MYKDKYVFAQLVSFLDRNHFNYLVRKYGGDKYVKFFSYWNQLDRFVSGRIRWARFRKHKGGIKIHTLYDIETQIPTFFHITSAKVNDVNAMDVIPYEIGSYYVFDRGYNDFKRLYRIKTLDSSFVVRSKKDLQYKCVKWSRRLPQKYALGC